MFDDQSELSAVTPQASRGGRAEPAGDGATAGVKSAERALTILECLTADPRPRTFSELVEQLGFPRSSMHALMKTLLAAGWVSFDDETRRYALGVRAWEAGNAYVRAVDLADRARRFMTRVRDELGETVQLAILDGRFNVYVAKMDGPNPLRLASQVGRRLEAHATGVGKVLLAGLDDDELTRRLGEGPLERFTPNTITSPARLRRELVAIREQGFGVDDEEYTIGVHCVAVPIYDHTDSVTAGMSVSVPSVRFSDTVARRALDVLLEESAALSAALGHRTGTMDRAAS